MEKGGEPTSGHEFLPQVGEFKNLRVTNEIRVEWWTSAESAVMPIA